MENNVDKNLVLAKLWNDILSEDIIPNNLPKNFIDLQNNVFRLNLLIQTNGKYKNKLESNEKFDSLVQKCNQYVLKSTDLESYIFQKSNPSSEKIENNCLTEVIEIMDTSSSETKIQDQLLENRVAECENSIPEKNSENEPKCKSKEGVTQQSISLNQIYSKLSLIKNALESENSNVIRDITLDVASNFDLNSVQIFSINLLDIENLKPDIQLSLENHRISLNENNIVLFFENLIELNSTITLLSYNISNTFLKIILTNYVLSGIIPSITNEQLSSLLSRKMFVLCSNLIKEFPRQFILSCFIPWIVEINSKISNKIFIEFIIKIVKECFNEQEANMLLTFLLTDFCTIKWTESVYNILSSLIDKISNLNVESFTSILNKMKNDSVDLAKSAIFSKFLLSLLNKCKNYLVVSVTSNQINEINDSFSTLSQSSQSKRLNNFKSNETVNYNKIYIEIIESIIENNQTLIKRTLLNLLKSYKS